MHIFDWRRALLQESDLTPTERLVALVLGSHMDGMGGSCFPSYDTLCKETGLSRGKMRDWLESIERKGWIEIESGGGRGNPNRYFANVPDDIAHDYRVRAETVSLGEETVSLGEENSLPGSTVGAIEEPEEPGVATTSRRTPSKRPSSQTPARRSRRPNHIWDVLVEHFGKPEASGASDLGRTASEVREVLEGVITDGDLGIDLDSDEALPFIRQQIGLRFAQMGEERYRTHRVLRRDWTRLGQLAGLVEAPRAWSAGVAPDGSAADPWQGETNPLGQLTECETCGEDLPNHHEDCPWHPRKQQA